MIDLYTWGTPNGKKASIALEELGLPYEVHPIDITKDDQFDPEYLKLSPNNKIPAIVDHDTGISLMESGAILLYLVHKTGRLMPEDDTGRWRAIEWLMWQMGGLGPMAGQAHHFLKFNPGKAPYAEDRYGNEVKRLYGVLDRRLDGQDFIAGSGEEAYSIADIASWPWIARFGWQGIDLDDYPNVKAWYARVAERPAVQRGYSVPKSDEIPQVG